MSIKRILKTMMVFFAGNVLSKLISFFLLPLYTSKISPTQYGNYDNVFSLINLIAPLAFFQIWDGMYRIAFDYKEKEDKDIVISNAVGFSSIGIVLYTVMFFFVNKLFDIYYYEYVWLYGLVFGFSYLFTFSLRVYLSNKLFVFSGLISTLVTAISNIILILGFDWDVKSIYLSAIIGLLVQMGIIEIKIGIFRHFRFRYIKKSIVHSMLKFSLPLCISTVSYWLLSGLTKIVIQASVGDYGNGIYAVANKFSVFITFLVTVIQYAWNETAYLISTEEKQERIKNYGISMNIMVVGVLVGTGFFCLMTKVVFPFMVDNQYGEALSIVPVCIIGTAINSLASFVGTFFLAEKRTNWLWISTIIAATCNVAGGYLSVKYWGLIGGVSLLAISFMVLALIRVLVSIKLFNIKLNNKTSIYSLVVLILSVFAFYSVDSPYITLSFLLVLIVGVLFLFRKKVGRIIEMIRK